EQARLHGGPRGLAGLAVEEDVLDRPDGVAVGVEHLLPPPALDVLKIGHADLPNRGLCVTAGRRLWRAVKACSGRGAHRLAGFGRLRVRVAPGDDELV